MKPLLFANWGSINRLFCSAMWMVALVLALVILVHSVNASAGCAGRSIAPGTPAGIAPATSACVSGTSHARPLGR
jgi:hypothetical protein